MPDIKYSIKYNRIKKAFIEGFEASENGVLTSTKAIHNVVCFEPINTAVADNEYGRLKFNLKISGNASLSVYYTANNELVDIPKDVSKIRSFCHSATVKRNVNTSDILLYDVSGQYFYLIFELDGDGSVEISDMSIALRGDNFMQTFPEVYQERNSFFHRYMSVFSSMFNDFEDEIEELPKLLNLDTCDKRFLPIYGSWLGIDVGEGFLEEAVLRQLVKESYSLNRMKGTKTCLERISEIILGEKGIIVERNSAQDYLSEEQLEEVNKLYGNTMSDVTLLIKEQVDEMQLSQLQYILEQFLPVNCDLSIVQLGSVGTLDTHTYLDINASVYSTGNGTLDSMLRLDENVTLA